MPNRFHRGEPVMVRVGVKGSYRWVSGEIERVTHSHGFATYCVLRYDTRKVERMVEPEDVQAWDWVDPEAKAREKQGADSFSYQNHKYRMKRRSLTHQGRGPK